MAEKKVKIVVKMLIQSGKANPAPPVGSTLGPHGINLMQFCKEFNDATSTMQGAVPAVVTVYEDRTFEFILKVAPVAELIKQALKVQSGSSDPLRKKIGELTTEQVREIAQKKLADLNAFDVEKAMKMVEGTARSMGVTVKS